MPEAQAHKNRVILRVDNEGRVAAVNEAARRRLGDYCVGKTCKEVVRGEMPDGTALCRPGCARELASGLANERGSVQARLKKDSDLTRIECCRVGNEVHVLIEPPAASDSTQRLTARERAVLALVSKGLSSTEIAKRLDICVTTVRTHVERARGRLGASTRAQAVLRAYQTGQLDGDN